MLYRILGVLVVVLMVGGLVLAEETRGTVVKIDDGSISVRSGGGFGNQKTEVVEKTFKMPKGVKIVRTAGKDREEISLTSDELKTAVKVTNVFVTVTHEGDNCSEIKVGGFGGGFGKKKKDNK
jgi:hypothetical protein